MARKKLAVKIENKSLIVSGTLQKNLPLKTKVNINGLKAIELAKYQAMALAYALAEVNGMVDKKPIKTKVDAYGNYPKMGTSAFSIWQACEAIAVNQYSLTKFVVYDLSRMSLRYGVTAEKPVNDANLRIEVNSFKKYLRNQAGS